MKLFPSLLLFLSCLALSSGFLRADDPVVANGDFSKGLEGWTLTMPESIGARFEIVPDGYEGKPALKLVVGDTDADYWQGRITVDAKFEPGASYTMKVFLMSEPDDGSIETVAWGRSVADKKSTLYSDRTIVKPTQSWEEFTLQFTVDAEPKETYGVSFNNLARANRTTWIANMTFTKD